MESQTSAMDLASDIKSGSAQRRETAIKRLVQLLNPRNRVANLSDLSDKSYHEIFEAIFSYVIREKPNYYAKGKSKSTLNKVTLRLSRCAVAVRMAVVRSVAKLGRKTLLAIIDHITQVLPGPDHDFVPPLLQDYIKALAEILSRQDRVELLARQSSLPWKNCVDFFLDVARYALPGEVELAIAPLSRASPAPNSLALRSTGGSSASTQSQRRGMGPGEGGPLRDVLETLLHLVQAANAPVSQRARQLCDVVIRFLETKQISLGTSQTLAFGILNLIFTSTQADDVEHAKSLTRRLLPLMSYWWRADKVSQDEVIRALRNEISRGIIQMHLHLEALAASPPDQLVLFDIVDLLDTLWSEYAKRGDAFRLHLSDVTFSLSSYPFSCPHLPFFGLRAHNIYGESHWAVVQNIAFLEGIILRSCDRAPDNDADGIEQPRKKRRTDRGSNRILFRLRDVGDAAREAALQVIPFMLARQDLGPLDLAELLPKLVALAGDKDTATASWTLVACASYLLRPDILQETTDIWRQIWHLTIRSLSLPGTSRAACVLLHAMLETDVLPYHAISEDINGVVTTADVNGPGVLSDSSISLMFHLLHLRNTKLPSASQSTCSHIIRWVFLRWNPHDSAYASFHSTHVKPIDFVNLIRACCGSKPLSLGTQAVFGGAFSESWKALRDIEPFGRYLLLLDDDRRVPPAMGCCSSTTTNSTLFAADRSSLYVSKKLVLELLFPKVADLDDLCTSWTKKSNEGGVRISFDRFQSLLSACLIGSMLLPQIRDLNSTQSSSIEASLQKLSERSLTVALGSIEPGAFVNLLLRILRPVTPDLNTISLIRFSSEDLGLLSLLAKLWNVVDGQQERTSSDAHSDFMDINHEFDSQNSKASQVSSQVSVPRLNSQIMIDERAFYIETKARLQFLKVVYDDPGQIGLVPEAYLDHLLSMPDDDLLSCQGLLIELFKSDLVATPDTALGIIERLGQVVSQTEYQYCEVALSTCIEVIEGLHHVWLNDKQHLSDAVGDLYNYFIQVCLTSNIFSAKGQVSMAHLLFTLLKADAEYGSRLGLSSCRTTLLDILSKGPMLVKSSIAEKIPNIFELYILKLHDEVFVDILDSLPSIAYDTAGIAFRILVLSKLARRWPTLLRRCTYHIFETPGKIVECTKYASRCLSDVSKTLGLESPQELFRLFARQLLYTWFEEGHVGDIPFAIFGFTSLPDLLRASQAEAIGITIMRGQETATVEVGKLLGSNEKDLIQANFTAAIAYSMMFADAFPSQEEGDNSEDYIKRRLGTKVFSDAIDANFVDIIAFFFDLIDQENPIENVFLKISGLEYAGKIMKAIKDTAHSPASLPPNQQPMFKARVLIQGIIRLCDYTDFQFHELWSPALVVSVARQLLNSVHPALGSLHACSVLRKVRILICLAGSVALQSYPLEMLLNSTRNFIVDSECADDALGISQYLLTEGLEHLTNVPSFLAGYALSTLASLRVFLESSQSSTTQESQFKATMCKAQQFHEWFSNYLSNYESPHFKSREQAKAFKSITSSAAKIRCSGNAEKDSSESKLLLDILKDESLKYQLLNESSRQLALGLLCGDFRIPASSKEDAIESDQDAIKNASSVWRSCKTDSLSEAYLSWAGRVIGRSFSASGEIPGDILRESRLADYQKMAPGPNGSEMGLLYLLQDLTSNQDSVTAGLAEAALRTVVSRAILHEDEPLIVACEKTLSEHLLMTSRWGSYRSPPSDLDLSASPEDSQTVWAQDITQKNWLPQISAYLARAVPNSIILTVLAPILGQVDDFAEKAFPFVVHLVLFFQLDWQQTLKRTLSSALKEWLQKTDLGAKNNLKLLLNTLLYLRTQEYPKESSIADRSAWLDVDYALVSSCATRCGMHKTSLLFAELVSSETSRSSRRSSTSRESDISETLLSIFENIDDPDAYYGLPEEANLSTVLARMEYENEGPKSLAFRGAQYDSHIRLQNSNSDSDSQALVKALNTLGLSGLSHSLLQIQRNLDATPESLESTFSTARKLEIWNLPAPSGDHHAVLVYKAYQSIHEASELSIARSAIHDGLGRTMRNLVEQSHNATAFRRQLAALASLTELDEVLGVSDILETDAVLARFEDRSKWMRSGLYDNVSQILSCRGTTMSMLSQQSSLRSDLKLSAATAKQMEIRSLLMASGIYRHHQASQESLNISTALTRMIAPCEGIGLHVDASVQVEAANSLWDYGEMSTSIRMLQGIDRDSALKRQTIPVSRLDLLSKLGHHISVARLEKPHDIQKRYLEPALKELKGNGYGREAGAVFHQFARFCDSQLQDPDGLEDLARLQNLKKGKSDEVAGLKALIAGTRESQLKTRYSHILSKEKQWLDLDDQELRRVEQTRSEFVRLSLENYLLALIASDEHDNDALRFTALWLERSDVDATNKAVGRHIDSVPTRKFATLMNQLTSRLQDQNTPFQKLLLDLIYNICLDHPYHGMYQIWSGTKARAQQKDEVAQMRLKATERVAQRLASSRIVSDTWVSIEKTSKYYHMLAMDRNNSKYKSGAKIALKDSPAGANLVNCLAKYRIPSPTMHIELSLTKDYSNVPTIARLDPTMTIASGVSAPKIITALGSDGVRYKQLVKGGHDDLRQDAIMEQVFSAVSSLLQLHRATQQRNLGIRTYKVLPLTASSGLIEFVPNTIPLHEFLMPAHERYHPKDYKGSQCRKEIFNVQNKTVETRVSTYRKVTERFHPVMRYFFMEYFADPDDWFVKRSAYTRSTAAISMLGHILGLGDRHGHNILLDTKTGEVVHIDLGVAFEAGRILPVPELVPFRLTRDIVDGMGITKTEGVFRRCCEFTLDALREEQYSIMTILDVLRYDPLYTWSISPLRLSKLQKARNDEDGAVDEGEPSEAEAKKGKRLGGHVNEPSEADRALEVVRKKLSKTLSVTATVNDLINQATDERNLAVLYSGWAAYA